MRIVTILMLKCFIFAFPASCQTNKKMESPLVTIIKLNSAEALGQFDEAKKYIDIKKVYSKHIQENVDFEKIWMEQVIFKYNLDKSSNKFTSQVKYYHYNIKEVIEGNKSTVIFTRDNSKASFSQIIYELEVVNGNWKVIGIDYIIYKIGSTESCLYLSKQDKPLGKPLGGFYNLLIYFTLTPVVVEQNP